MTTSELPAHSPLGASGAYRWMACPGSVTLSRGIDDPESEHAALGTAAHTLCEYCLTRKVEPWTAIGSYVIKGDEIEPVDSNFEDTEGWIPVDKEMADCVAGYMAEIKLYHPFQHQGNTWVERRFHCPEIHPMFYGTSDFVYLTEVGTEYMDVDIGEVKEATVTTLDVWDYKHGVGIVVEADDNPQLMYYACGVLEDLNLWDQVDEVRLHIYQPRGWHWKGPHRYWTISTDDLDAWLFDTCVPAMEHALVSRDTKTGEHCRFCPARFAQCEAMLSDLQEYALLVLEIDDLVEVEVEKVKKGEKVERKQVIKGADRLTPEQIGRIIQLNEINKIALKAALQAGHGLLSNGKEVPGCKLVKSRTNREFKDGAEAAAVKKFGKKGAFTEPTLKSPAQMDALPGGKEFTARWAFKPEGGTTIAVEGDPRRAIKLDVKSLFKPVK